MRQTFFTYLFASLVAVFGFQSESLAQLIPCSECTANGGTSSPNFVLSLDAQAINNNGGGMTQSAVVRVLFKNRSTVALNLTTISFALAFNSGNVSSLSSITADAFSGTWIQNTQLSPPAVFVNEDFSALSPPKTIFANTYDQVFEYSHTGSGPPHPSQNIASGSRIHIMTITMTFNSTQAFQISDPGMPGYLLADANMYIIPGECYEPCPNVNNQWGFENAMGQSMLVNCYNTKNLPIELISFTGEAFPGYNELYWETATELNSEWHIIERSANPNTEEFAEVGRVQAAGESFEPISYSLRDLSPLELSYYRLKAVDFDGSFAYSNIVVLRREILDDGTFTVYPNPTSSTVIVETAFSSRSDVTVEVIDAIGRVLATTVYPDFTGFFQEELNLDYYAPGMYFIRLDNGSRTHEAKIIKQ